MNDIDKMYDGRNNIMSLIRSGFKVTMPNNEIIYKINGNIISELNGEIKEIDEGYIDKSLKSFEFWELRNKDYIEVNNMSTSHIQNALNFSNGKLAFTDHGSELRKYFKKFKTIFTRILRDRNIDKVLNDDDFSDIGIDI